MTYLKNFFLLSLFLGINSAFCAKIPSFIIKGLDAYQGDNITVYALSAKSELISGRYEIHAVLRPLLVSKISSLDLRIPSLDIPSKETVPFVANSILVSVHKQSVFVPGKESHLQYSVFPKLLGDLNKLVLKENNQDFLFKEFRSIKSLGKGPNINLN